MNEKTLKNSLTEAKETEVIEKKNEKIISGNARIKKKSGFDKVRNALISEDVTNVKSYIFLDVLIPAAKKAISDIVTNGIDMILYGETGHSKRKSISSGVSYRSYYERKNDDVKPTNRNSTFHDQSDVVFDTRAEAEEVLERLCELIGTYGVASVADLYELAGLSVHYTDNKYGWTSLKTAEVKRVRDGYVVKMPKAMAID